jgi:hypothetical protein
VDHTTLKESLKRYGFDDSDPLTVWLNAALHDIESRADWRFLQRTSAGIPVAAGNNVVATPADYKRSYKLRDTTEELSTGGVGYDLEYWDPRKWDRDIDNESKPGKPEVFTEWESILLLWPVPDTAREFSLYYQGFLEELDDPDDVPGLPGQFHYTIVRGAAFIALQAENEEDRAETAQGQFESDIANMIATYDTIQIGEPEEVADVMDYAGSY